MFDVHLFSVPPEQQQLSAYDPLLLDFGLPTEIRV